MGPLGLFESLAFGPAQPRKKIFFQTLLHTVYHFEIHIAVAALLKTFDFKAIFGQAHCWPLTFLIYGPSRILRENSRIFAFLV